MSTPVVLISVPKRAERRALVDEYCRLSEEVSAKKKRKEVLQAQIESWHPELGTNPFATKREEGNAFILDISVRENQRKVTGVEKLYQALVAGLPTPDSLSKLTEGVWLSDGKVRAKRVRIAGRRGQATMLELVLAEGKKREIRRMLAKLGHKVMSLNRVAVGPISVKGLSTGECRSLSRHEVDLLWKVANGA